MAAKDGRFGTDARARMMRSVGLLADPVKVTLMTTGAMVSERLIKPAAESEFNDE